MHLYRHNRCPSDFAHAQIDSNSLKKLVDIFNNKIINLRLPKFKNQNFMCVYNNWIHGIGCCYLNQIIRHVSMLGMQKKKEIVMLFQIQYSFIKKYKQCWSIKHFAFWEGKYISK